jgi:hypothetical protein
MLGMQESLAWILPWNLPDPIRGRVDIEIIYQPKNSLDTRSLVYPFYLALEEKSLAWGEENFYIE